MIEFGDKPRMMSPSQLRQETEVIVKMARANVTELQARSRQATKNALKLLVPALVGEVQMQ